MGMASDNKITEDGLPDLKSAVRYFINELLGGDGYIISYMSGNKGPIAVKVGDLRTWKENRIYYVAYNRKLLDAFGRLFHMPSESTSQGQTIHLRVLDDAVNNPMFSSKAVVAGKKSYIVIMMPDKSAYTIQASEWWKYYEAYNTKRVIQGEGEFSVSIPIRYMHQFESDEPKDGGSMLSYVE